jgi:hypothetical protein
MAYKYRYFKFITICKLIPYKNTEWPPPQTI